MFDSNVWASLKVDFKEKFDFGINYVPQRSRRKKEGDVEVGNSEEFFSGKKQTRRSRAKQEKIEEQW